MSEPQPGVRSGRRKSAWVVNLALAAASLIALFGVGEMVIRGIESARPTADAIGKSWAIYDENLGYRPRPGVGDVNAHGLRGAPVDDPKRRFRVLILGDSVAFYGDDPDDTFPGQLGRILGSDAHLVATEVLNAGVRGYTNYQELVYLQKYGVALEPDLVGVAFVLNDLHRILHRFKVENGKIVGQEYRFSDQAIQSVDSPLYQLARRSHLLVWLRRQLSVFDSMIDLYAGSRFSFDYRPDFNTAWQAQPWRTIEDQLSAMVMLGRDRGFRVFLVAFPFGEQLRPDYLARDRAYVTYPQVRLAEITSRLGIAYLDLMPELDLAQDFETDRVHLSKHGRAVAGRRIARFLADEGLVPKVPPASLPVPVPTR